eukprot:2495501-Alexandrium_andersonii.AAC.1
MCLQDPRGVARAVDPLLVCTERVAGNLREALHFAAGFPARTPRSQHLQHSGSQSRSGSLGRPLIVRACDPRSARFLARTTFLR